MLLLASFVRVLCTQSLTRLCTGAGQKQWEIMVGFAHGCICKVCLPVRSSRQSLGVLRHKPLALILLAWSC